jgi:hypothetical protein
VGSAARAVNVVNVSAATAHAHKLRTSNFITDSFFRLIDPANPADPALEGLAYYRKSGLALQAFLSYFANLIYS